MGQVDLSLPQSILAISCPEIYRRISSQYYAVAPFMSTIYFHPLNVFFFAPLCLTFRNTWYAPYSSESVSCSSLKQERDWRIWCRFSNCWDFIAYWKSGVSPPKFLDLKSLLELSAMSVVFWGKNRGASTKIHTNTRTIRHISVMSSWIAFESLPCI